MDISPRHKKKKTFYAHNITTYTNIFYTSNCEFLLQTITFERFSWKTYRVIMQRKQQKNDNLNKHHS